MKIISSILILFSLVINAYGQAIKWTSFSDLNDSLKANPKKVIIKIETDWCGYCKMMDAKVFNHNKVVKKINNHYYFVKLNAESKEDIVFRNHLFSPSKYQSGKHELAIALNGEKNVVSYPTIILLSSNLEVENRLNGYLKRNHFLLWLKN